VYLCICSYGRYGCGQYFQHPYLIFWTPEGKTSQRYAFSATMILLLCMWTIRSNNGLFCFFPVVILFSFCCSIWSAVSGLVVRTVGDNLLPIQSSYGLPFHLYGKNGRYYWLTCVHPSWWLEVFLGIPLVACLCFFSEASPVTFPLCESCCFFHSLESIDTQVPVSCVVVCGGGDGGRVQRLVQLTRNHGYRRYWPAILTTYTLKYCFIYLAWEVSRRHIWLGSCFVTQCPFDGALGRFWREEQRTARPYAAQLHKDSCVTLCRASWNVWICIITMFEISGGQSTTRHHLVSATSCSTCVGVENSGILFDDWDLILSMCSLWPSW